MPLYLKRPTPNDVSLSLVIILRYHAIKNNYLLYVNYSLSFSNSEVEIPICLAIWSSSSYVAFSII